MKRMILLLSVLSCTQTFCLSQNRWTQMNTFYANKKVLVTGGCGFIGSHICEKLVELGAQVTILDDLSSGFEKNIQTFKHNVTFFHGTITDKAVCTELTKNKDIIFHLAALVSVPESIEHPQICHETNVNGIATLLEAARINNVSRFVFSSSSAVYGNHEGACSESTPCNPTSPYGFSKRIGELLCQQYAKSFGLHAVSLRYFNVWGPRQNPNGAYAAVIAKFSDLMADNKPLTIFGDGKQTRDFVPVAKVVEANLVLGMLADQKNVRGQIFNVATGKSINLFELIETLKKDFPSYSAAIQFAPARPGDIHDSSADCGKFMEVVG